MNRKARGTTEGWEAGEASGIREQKKRGGL